MIYINIYIHIHTIIGYIKNVNTNINGFDLYIQECEEKFL